jgi:uncharacterized membrane protein (DUF485 family)
MPPEDLAAVRQSPAFRRLAAARLRLNLGLCGILLAAYGFYVFAMAWLPALMGAGAPISVGVWFAAGLNVFGVVLSGIYLWYANARLDALRQRLLDELGDDRAPPA